MEILFFAAKEYTDSDKNNLEVGMYQCLDKIGHQLTIEYNNGFPQLFFRDIDKLNEFFNYFQVPGDAGIMFLLEEKHQSKKFHNKKFYDSTRHQELISTILSNSSFAFYSNRLLAFNFCQRNPIEILQDTKNPTIDPNKELNAYFVIIAYNVERAGNFFYDNFFKEKPCLPLALPLSELFNEDNYFCEKFVSYRNTLRSLPEFEKIKNTLFYTLWELTDRCVYREYLRQGGFFDIHTIFQNEDKPIYNDGKINFRFLNYYLASEDQIERQWWAELMIPDEYPAVSDRSRIKNALIHDLKNSIPGINIDIKAISQTSQTTDTKFQWSKLCLNTMDEIDENSVKIPQGPAESIRMFFSRFQDDDLKRFVNQKIVGLQGNDNPENSLHVFCEYLCKSPFKTPPQDEVLNFNLSDLWEHFILFIIMNIRSVQTYEYLHQAFQDFFSIENENYEFRDGICSYKFLSPKEIVYLRLLLPVDTEFKSLNTNILDDPNAILDSKFILE